MNPRPAAFLESLTARLIPAPCRENIAGDLHERYRSNGQYVVGALRTVPFAILSQIRRTFDPAFLVIQACGLYMAFQAAWRFSEMPLLTDASQLLRLLVPVFAGLVGLVLRDAYVDHNCRTPLKSLLDAAFGVAFAFVAAIVANQFVTTSLDVRGARPGLALPWNVTGKAALIAVFILSLVRMTLWAVMRPEKGPLQIVAAATRFQKGIRSRNIREYIAAAFVVIVFGSFIVRAPSAGPRVVFSLIIIVTVYAIYWLHKKGWAGKIPPNLSPDGYREMYRQQLVRQRDLVHGAWKGLAIMFIPILLILFATPAPLAARLELRTMGLATFTLTFVLIGKLNRLAARKLTQRIKTLDDLEPRQ